MRELGLDLDDCIAVESVCVYALLGPTNDADGALDALDGE